ncbi:MAG: hypothetical protein IMZ61_04655 [Planctomycetes bacterium]|nr:hypothetical protein [Planctomycetota bacterium]
MWRLKERFEGWFREREDTRKGEILDWIQKDPERVARYIMYLETGGVFYDFWRF